MSVVDIHPEELLERFEAGQLERPERLRLMAHLAACDACRFELALRADLRADARLAGVPADKSDPASRRNGENARASGIGQLGPASTPRAPAFRRLPRRATAWNVTAALLVLGGAAFAAHAIHEKWRTNAAPLLVASSPPEPGPSSPTGPGALAASADATTEARALASARPTFDSLDTLDSLAHSLPPAVSVKASPRPAPEAGAGALFSAANAARRRGDVVRAIALYRTLERRFPSAQETLVSRVILGRLFLKRDAAAALAEFDAYLAGPAPSMIAEALVGRARALTLLHRDDASRAAWQELVARFPRSVYADEARSALQVARSP